MLLQTMFNAGLCMMVARWTAASQDVTQLIPFVMTTWRYLSGVFYSIYVFTETAPAWVRDLLFANPATVYIELVRGLPDDQPLGAGLPLVVRGGLGGRDPARRLLRVLPRRGVLRPWLSPMRRRTPATPVAERAPTVVCDDLNVVYKVMSPGGLVLGSRLGAQAAARAGPRGGLPAGPRRRGVSRSSRARVTPSR